MTSELMKVFGPSLLAMDSSQAAASLSESFLDWQLGKYKLKVKEITGKKTETMTSAGLPICSFFSFVFPPEKETVVEWKLSYSLRDSKDASLRATFVPADFLLAFKFDHHRPTASEADLAHGSASQRVSDLKVIYPTNASNEEYKHCLLSSETAPLISYCEAHVDFSAAFRGFESYLRLSHDRFMTLHSDILEDGDLVEVEVEPDMCLTFKTSSGVEIATMTWALELREVDMSYAEKYLVKFTDKGNCLGLFHTSKV